MVPVSWGLGRGDFAGADGSYLKMNAKFKLMDHRSFLEGWGGWWVGDMVARGGGMGWVWGRKAPCKNWPFGDGGLWVQQGDPRAGVRHHD